LLFHWLRTPRIRALLVARANLSNQASINQQGLNGLPIAVPKSDEQERMLENVRVIDDSVATGTSELSKLVEIKSGLMTDLLIGRVRVPKSAVSLGADQEQI